MILLNSDYSTIESQMTYIRKYLSQHLDDSEIFDAMELHRALEASIGITNKEKYAFPAKLDEIYKWEKLRSISNLENRFQEESPFHKRFLTTAYSTLMPLQKELERTTPYIHGENYSIINKEEDLLNSFFEEENIILKDIFNDMIRQEQFFSNNKRENPNAIYNHLQGIPSVFTYKEDKNIIGLATIVHEIGHIYDAITLYQENKEKAFSYTYCSLYQEVFSYYYEQKFLYFLIENTSYKIEAQNELLNHLGLLTNDLKILRRSFSSSIYNTYQMASLIQYAYGPIIANCIMASSEKKQAFKRLEYDPFDSSKLIGMGLTPIEAAQTAKNKIKTYFNTSYEV